MSRRPKVKTCADPACPLTFTGRGLYCEGHRAGRDKPGSKLRKERKAASKRRRRDQAWQARFTSPAAGSDPTTGVATPLHPGSASSQVTALPPTRHSGHSRPGPAPIDVVGTPGMTAARAIDQFMAAWNLHHQPEGSTTP